MRAVTRRDFMKAASVCSIAMATSRLDAAEVPADRPNILFIMTDQQFGDAMSCRMGKKWLNTPAMDSLAANGTLFAKAYSPNPLCMPARNSIFTGRYPHETGVTKKRQCDKLVNTGIDILPTMLDYAGIVIPNKLPGRSVRPIVAGKLPADWRNHVVIQNHLSQTVAVDGIRATAQGRMVRTERYKYKYCVYDHGTQRESLIDMKNDPLETKNIATEPAQKKTIEAHRKLLLAFAAKHNDPLAKQMLANDMPAIPFEAAKPKTKNTTKKRKKKS